MRPEAPQRAVLLGALALLAASLWLRLGWLPLERHTWDGHELDYLRAAEGAALPGSLRLHPAVVALYRAVAVFGDAPRAILALNLGLGAVTPLLAALALRRRLGATAAGVAGLLLALSPAHVAWSASAYPVALPQALLMSGLALGGARGALPVAAACALRPELALGAPVFAWLGGARVAMGALGAALALPLLDGGPPLRSPALTLPANLRLVGLLGPWAAPAGLGALALSLGRPALAPLAAAAWVYAGAAAFDDMGERHLLLAMAALAGAVGTARGWRRLAWPLALAASVAGLAELHPRFYSGNEAFRAQLPALGPPPEGCVEVLDDPLDPRSHWRLRAEGWPPGPLCWGEEAIHHAWTSRALADRALRMKVLYDARPIGVVELDHGPRLIWSLRP